MVSGRKKRKSLDLLDKQILVQVMFENRIFSRAYELERRRKRLGMHRQYVV